MLKSNFLVLNNEDVEVVYTSSDAEPGDRDHRSWPKEINIESVKYCDVDIMAFITDDQIEELKEQLKDE